eukprot:100-Heterococcus_DN1.PRE.2
MSIILYAPLAVVIRSCCSGCSHSSGECTHCASASLHIAARLCCAAFPACVDAHSAHQQHAAARTMTSVVQPSQLFVQARIILDYYRVHIIQHLVVVAIVVLLAVTQCMPAALVAAIAKYADACSSPKKRPLALKHYPAAETTCTA